jgi:hypothetical protein
VTDRETFGNAQLVRTRRINRLNLQCTNLNGTPRLLLCEQLLRNVAVLLDDVDRLAENGLR